MMDGAAAAPEATQPLLLKKQKKPVRRGTPTDVSPMLKAAAILRCFPVVDVATDVAMLGCLVGGGWYSWALAVGGLLVLQMRFLSLYVSMRPSPELSNLLLLYTPFLALPFFNDISGHASGQIVEDMYDQAGLLRQRGTKLEDEVDVEAATAASSAAPTADLVRRLSESVGAVAQLFRRRRRRRAYHHPPRPPRRAPRPRPRSPPSTAGRPAASRGDG